MSIETDLVRKSDGSRLVTCGEVMLEVIVCSVVDAIEAQRGGASRLEVVRDLQVGGLTPSLELVREIKSSVGLPLRVMVRETSGFETNDEDEIGRLCDDVLRLDHLGVDGVVIGFLKDGMIDVELTNRILRCAPNVKATFHHAFEDAHDKMEALEMIRQIPQIDRVLSHGDGNAETLASYARVSSVPILAGGGIDAKAILEIGRSTPIREFHVGRAARVDDRVDSALVRKLVDRCREIAMSDTL